MTNKPEQEIEVDFVANIGIIHFGDSHSGGWRTDLVLYYRYDNREWRDVTNTLYMNPHDMDTLATVIYKEWSLTNNHYSAFPGVVDRYHIRTPNHDYGTDVRLPADFAQKIFQLWRDVSNRLIEKAEDGPKDIEHRETGYFTEKIKVTELQDDD